MSLRENRRCGSTLVEHFYYTGHILAAREPKQLLGL
jgi:hypothetical protein